MALPLPRSLSPSAVASFTDCGLQFRFSVVERLPEAPSAAAVRGTLVHAALEALYALPAPERVPEAVPTCVDAAIEALAEHPEWIELALGPDEVATMRAEAEALAGNLFQLEDPRTVQAIGLELKLEVEVDGVAVRGIIDRLDLVDGELVVTDYKTGRAPGEGWARPRMAGVHVYSLMCERHFGRRPVRVQLLHLAEPVAMVAEPSDQSSQGLSRRLGAVWQAIADGCEREDFRPRPGPRCGWCGFQRWCPAFGGDPTQARVDLEVRRRAEEDGQVSLLSG